MVFSAKLTGQCTCAHVVLWAMLLNPGSHFRLWKTAICFTFISTCQRFTTHCIFILHVLSGHLFSASGHSIL